MSTDRYQALADKFSSEGISLTRSEAKLQAAQFVWGVQLKEPNHTIVERWICDQVLQRDAERRQMILREQMQ